LQNQNAQAPAQPAAVPPTQAPPTGSRRSSATGFTDTGKANSSVGMVDPVTGKKYKRGDYMTMPPPEAAQAQQPAPTAPVTQAGSGAAQAQPNFENLKSQASDNEDRAFIGYMEELYSSPLKPSVKSAIGTLLDASATAEEVRAANQHLLENGINLNEAFPNRSVAKQQAQMTAF
jgi:hypothetical protein